MVPLSQTRNSGNSHGLPCAEAPSQSPLAWRAPFRATEPKQSRNPKQLIGFGKGSFGKGVFSEKSIFLEILENLEILDFRKGDSDHFLRF